MKPLLTKPLFILFPLIMLVVACSDDDSTPYIDIDPYGGINLAVPTEGSVFTYLMYESGCDGGFAFTGDTLIVEVVRHDDDLYLKESYSPGSTLDVEVEHLIIPRDGYVLLPERINSQLLFFFGNDTIWLDREPDVSLVQNGCRLFQEGEAFVGDAIGSVNMFRFGEMRITDKKAISCVPGVFELDAYIFYGDFLNVVHTIREVDSETSIVGFMGFREVYPID